jgi:peptidoglycan/xylan/chitin deacetylase (PgdA/CDA1 family)
MYLIKTPKIIQKIFPKFIWKINTTEKEMFLTFDDGPVPEVTPWVLSQLKKYDAKATFFCVGDNINKYPDTFKEIINEGHRVGNHTFNHLNGWTTDNRPYYHNVKNCAELVRSNLFRPPYGRLRPKQAQFLQRHYNIIMWDVLSGDFDQNTSKEKCFQNVVLNAKSGSIIVFHDSLKAIDNLKYTLPRVLKYYSSLGYKFKAIRGSSILAKKIA